MKAGVIRAVCVGSGGIPKYPVEAAVVGELGLEGDGHRYHLHGGVERAVCLFALEDYATLARDRVQADPPGAFGENLLTEGLDYGDLRPGDRLEIGELLLEIQDIREPCITLKKVDARFPDLMVGRSGYMCSVLRPGEVRPGMDITKIETRIETH